MSDDVSRVKQGGPVRRLWNFLPEPAEAERVEQLRSIHGGAPLMTRERFRRYKARYVLIACIWLAGLVAALAVVDGWWRLLVACVFMLLTPALGDLTERYHDYRSDREIGNSSARRERPTTDH